MRKALVLLALATISTWSACTPAPYAPIIPRAVPKGDPKKQADEDDIRELAFREMLRKEPSGETCYISFHERGFEGWIDPPEEFIARLQFPQLKLKKVSEARHPRPDERDPKDPDRYVAVRDPQTGKPSNVYYVGIDWISADEAKASAGLTQGPLSGGGCEWRVARERGTWILKEGLRRSIH